MLRRVATGSGGFFWSADGVFGAGALQVAPELIQVVLGVFQAGVGSLLHFLLHFLLGELVYGGLRKLLVDVVLVEVVFATVHGGRQVGKGWYSLFVFNFVVCLTVKCLFTVRVQVRVRFRLCAG